MFREITSDDIIENLGPNFQDSDDVIQECLSICRAYSLAPKELSFKWEAYIINIQPAGDDDDIKPTLAHLQQLRKKIDHDFNASMKTKAMPSASKTVVKRERDSSMHVYDKDSVEGFLQNMGSSSVTPRSKKTMLMSTPESKRSSFNNDDPYTTPSKRSSASTGLSQVLSASRLADSSSKFAERENKGKIELTLNQQLKIAEFQVNSHKRCEVNAVQEMIEPYKYMFEMMNDRGDVLDDRIEYFQDIIRKFYNIDVFSNPSYLSQEPITAIGRICCDADGKMNESSVVFESSRRMGAGQRIKLMLRDIPSFSLFPGMICAIEGVNGGGGYFNVSKILTPPLPPVVIHDSAELMEYNYGPARMNGKPLSFIIAVGPYTLDGNLLFETFDELIKRCIMEKPDILLLLGPFIDAKHPSIMLGDIDYSPQKLFHTFISEPLDRLIKLSPSTTVIIVPSINDLVQEYMIFPQPLFDKIELKLPREVVCVSNPCQLKINEVVIGIESMDVLFGIGTMEAARSSELDRLKRLASHLLQQRSFYPLYPPALGDNVSIENLPRVEMQVTPDILIVPSRLQFFAKIIDGVVCVNPGFLSKGNNGGTFARFTLHPLERTAITKVDVKSKIWERTRVDLVRI